jgi:hypothetical protein
VPLPLEPPLPPAPKLLPPQALHSVTMASKSLELDMGLRGLRVSKRLRRQSNLTCLTRVSNSRSGVVFA